MPNRALALLAVVTLPLLSFTTPAGAATWKSDPAHSAAHFEVTHLMVAKVRGDFDQIEATIDLDEKDPTASKVQVKIPVASIDTRNDKRDTHLQSDDFFAAETHPYITFESTGIKKTGENTYEVTGKLTMRGQTRTETVKVEASPVVKNPFSGTPTRGFTVTGTLDRTDYGLTWNKALEAGGVLVGDEVDILVELEASPAAQASN